LGRVVGRVWLRVALAAGAGLAPLVVCSGAPVAIVLLLFSTTSGFVLSSSAPSPFFWVGLVIILIVATASFSLPALALGARGGHLTKTALLSGIGFCAFVVFVFASFEHVTAVPYALLALVATPVVGSLVAVREEGPLTARLGRATGIAAVAIYCASLLAWWLVPVEEVWLYAWSPFIVAASSWAVLPGIVALLRPG
jgi:hypothetical protein